MLKLLVAQRASKLRHLKGFSLSLYIGKYHCAHLRPSYGPGLHFFSCKFPYVDMYLVFTRKYSLCGYFLASPGRQKKIKCRENITLLGPWQTMELKWQKWYVTDITDGWTDGRTDVWTERRVSWNIVLDFLQGHFTWNETALTCNLFNLVINKHKPRLSN